MNVWTLGPSPRVLLALIVALALTVPLVSAPLTADAHRSGCHRHHTCPSDHATYVWHGYRCVKPSASERTSKFRKKIRYDGRTYYCKRA